MNHSKEIKVIIWGLFENCRGTEFKTNKSNCGNFIRSKLKIFFCTSSKIAKYSKIKPEKINWIKAREYESPKFAEILFFYSSVSYFASSPLLNRVNRSNFNRHYFLASQMSVFGDRVRRQIQLKRDFICSDDRILISWRKLFIFGFVRLSRSGKINHQSAFMCSEPDSRIMWRSSILGNLAIPWKTFLSGNFERYWLNYQQ